MEFHPCGICGVHVLETDEAVQCDGLCSLWHHRECLGMTLAEYLKLSKGQEDWFCRKCVIKKEIKQEADAERRRQRKSEMGKSKIECKKLDSLSGDQKCVFCHQTDIDEIRYGPIYMHKNIITHYYCLLLSSNMEQNGRDCDGILGFLASDIHKEVKRGVKLYCTYCRNGGATLGCAIAKCKVVFHLPCGIRHGTLHQFYGEFKSYCAKHRPVQRISAKILAESSRNAMCGICYEKVVPRPIHETLWAPCCKKSAFFHRDCVQKLALSAGYFFKCPLCNNTSAFQKEMKEFGIYIPEQDASWECVPNAYQDLLVRHDSCDSASCSCPSGRKTNNQGTRWELILCKFCGSQGIHIGCGRLKWKSPEFVCGTCAGNNEEDEGNTRNHEGNRHRLSGNRRTADVHTSVPAKREGEPSDEDSSDESTKVVLSNRAGRRRVVSPPTREIETPPPDVKVEKKSEKLGKRSGPTSTIKLDDTPPDDDTVVIVDSDDDVEVVSTEDQPDCLKTNDGSTIPIIHVMDKKKRLNIVGDVNVHDEIVDITIQMEGPPRKKTPSPHVEEVIYSLPTLPPKPSTSTSYCAPSTSFSAPPDITKFVIVDPSTFRPEDLPPGTVLYRSVTPMVPMPQTSTPSQPPMPPVPPTGQVPMPQLGGSSGCSADAEHPDLGQHRGRSRFHLHASTNHLKKTTRTIKHNSCGRRRRGRCDINRLIPRITVSPLKFRMSHNGYYEVLVPRRNLASSYKSLFGYGSLKRKTSPLPPRPAKKIKKSSKKKDINENKQFEKSHKKIKTSKSGKDTSSKSRSKRKEENKKLEDSLNYISTPGNSKVKTDNNSPPITMYFSSNKSDMKTTKKKSPPLPKNNGGEGKENTSLKEKSTVKKNRKEKTSPLLTWRDRKIDEFLNKFKVEHISESSEKNNKNVEIVKSLLNELITVAVEQNVSNELTIPEINNDSSPCIADLIDFTVENCFLENFSSKGGETSSDVTLEICTTNSGVQDTSTVPETPEEHSSSGKTLTEASSSDLVQGSCGESETKLQPTSSPSKSCVVPVNTLLSTTEEHIKENENELQIKSDCKQRCALKTDVGFPKIKFKTSKEKSASNKRKVADENKRKPTVKKKLVEIKSECKIGAIERYFCSIKKDPSTSAVNNFGNTSSDNINITNDFIVPPLASLESSRFWKMLDDQNSSNKTTPGFQPTTSKFEKVLHNQNSPVKIPLMELKLNSTVTSNS